MQPNRSMPWSPKLLSGGVNSPSFVYAPKLATERFILSEGWRNASTVEGVEALQRLESEVRPARR